MAPRKTPPNIKLIAQEILEGGASPELVSQILSEEPYSYPVDPRTIQRWAKAGNWGDWKVTLSSLPKAEKTDPHEETMRHLCIELAKKRHNEHRTIDKSQIPNILMAVIAEYNPPKRVIAYLRDVFLPSYIKSGREYNPFDFETYKTLYNMSPDMSYAEGMKDESPSASDTPPSISDLRLQQNNIKAEMNKLINQINTIEGQLQEIEQSQIEQPFSDEELKAEIERIKKEGESE